MVWKVAQPVMQFFHGGSGLPKENLRLDWSGVGSRMIAGQ
jgi:hypothetical protein